RRRERRRHVVAIPEVPKGGAAVGARCRVRSQRGFTLLELIVTLLILMIVIGVSVPVVGRSSEAVRSRAEIASFSAMLRRARERAITSRVSQIVVIDPAAHTMTVLSGPEAEVRETRQLPERLSVEATPPPALTVR